MIDDVVNRNIPLLISKKEMKERGFKLNLEDDTLELDGSVLELDTTDSGHYKLPIMKFEEVNVSNIAVKTTPEKKKIVKKLHRQFFHPSTESLKNLLKQAGETDAEMENLIDELSESCDFCKRYRKTRPRPVVCYPLANRFNQVVAMDLKHYKDLYFIHFIDLFTRYSKAKVITRKMPAVVVKSFIMEWIGIGLGAPEKLLVDNGGEFNNPDYLDAMEQINVEVMATAVNSPWSNGGFVRETIVLLMILW